MGAMAPISHQGALCTHSWFISVVVFRGENSTRILGKVRAPVSSRLLSQIDWLCISPQAVPRSCHIPVPASFSESLPSVLETQWCWIEYPHCPAALRPPNCPGAGQEGEVTRTHLPPGYPGYKRTFQWKWVRDLWSQEQEIQGQPDMGFSL